MSDNTLHKNIHPDLYTQNEAARIVGIHEVTLYRWIRSGKVPRPKRHVRTGRKLFTQTDIDAVIEYRDRKE